MYVYIRIHIISYQANGWPDVEIICISASRQTKHMGKNILAKPQWRHATAICSLTNHPTCVPARHASGLI